MTSRSIVVALAALLLAADVASAQQSRREREREKERIEREKERAEEQREKERERREEEREKAQEARERAREQAEEQRERAQERAERLRERAQEQREKERERERDRARQYSSGRSRTDESDRSERVDTTVALSRGGVVTLEVVVGEIVVSGWSRNEVRVRGVTEMGTLRFESSASRVSLKALARSGRAGEARLEVSVPHGARVVLGSMSGEVSARGTRGPVEAKTMSGEIEIVGASEHVSFSTVSGEVTVSDVAGDVHGTSMSGEVSLEGVTGDIEVETVSGEVSLGDVRSKFVRLKSISADLQYDGAIDATGRYELHSHSGSVRVELPTGVGAVVEVQTFSGSIESDFPMQLGRGTHVLGASSTKKFDFTIGGGGARISAGSFSGDVYIGRAGERRTARDER